jgi:phage virion morphogenesis protein
MNFAVTSIELANINGRLRALAARFDDLTPLMQYSAATAAFASERAFETESDPATGTKWEPLSPRTQLSFVAKGQRRGAHPILQVTGRLAASLVTTVSKFSATLGTNVIYAAIQFFGGVTGRNYAAEIPARRFMGISPNDATAIEQEAVRFLTEAAS